MVGNNTERNVLFLIFFIINTGDPADVLHDILNGVHLEKVINALHSTGKSFQSHTRINIFMSHFGIITVSVAVELRENKIPNLDNTVAVAGLFKAFKRTVAFSPVKMYFGTRSAGSAAVFPEIVSFAKTLYALLGYAYIVHPNLLGLVVTFKNGDPKPVCRNSQYTCQKFPRPGNSFLFKIVPEREIAKHFKISSVTGGLSHSFNIGSADTLLTSSDPYVRRSFLPEEKLFKRSHTAVYKQETVIAVRDKRSTRHSCMIFAFKKRKIFFSKVIQACPFHI